MVQQHIKMHLFLHLWYWNSLESCPRSLLLFLNLPGLHQTAWEYVYRIRVVLRQPMTFMVHQFCCRQGIPTYRARVLHLFKFIFRPTNHQRKSATTTNNQQPTTKHKRDKHHQVTLIKVFQVTSSGHKTFSIMSSSNWTAEAHDPPSRSHALWKAKVQNQVQRKITREHGYNFIFRHFDFIRKDIVFLTVVNQNICMHMLRNSDNEILSKRAISKLNDGCSNMSWHDSTRWKGVCFPEQTVRGCHHLASRYSNRHIVDNQIHLMVIGTTCLLFH